nr:hypothetical protein [Candidatus Brocadiales bacterium]
MTKEELIKRFEEDTGEKRPPVISTVAYHSNAHDRWVEAFTNWLLSKVIAQGEDNERLKPEKGGLRPDEYMHEWMEQDAVGFDLPPEEIIEHLCRDNRLLQ